MKNSIYIIVLIFITTLSFAQKYYPQPELNKYNGTWEYSTGNEKFTVVLKSEKTFMKSFNIYIDVLKGHHSYILNGKVVQSSLSSIEPSLMFGGVAKKEQSLTKLHFLFSDSEKVKNGDLIIDFLPGKTDEISWELTNTEGVRYGKYDYDFSVPLKMTLKKVE